ncbi:MAG: hypothetical protein AAFO15_01310 [Pseudomonadota bacterium]
MQNEYIVNTTIIDQNEDPLELVGEFFNVLLEEINEEVGTETHVRSGIQNDMVILYKKQMELSSNTIFQNDLPAYSVQERTDTHRELVSIKVKKLIMSIHRSHLTQTIS